MLGTHFETREIEMRSAECGVRNDGVRNIPQSALRNPQSAFTLVELLVVITIITILAGLTTGAVIRALNRAKQTRITFELNQLGTAVEDLKNELGAYPPNGMMRTVAPVNSLAHNDFVRMFKKAFPRSQEPQKLILALAGAPDSTSPTVVTQSSIENLGMSGAEAMFFWLGGFSKDPAYPISGPGGPSFIDTDGNDTDGDGSNLDAIDETVEERNLSYEFDLGRVGPRDSNDIFNGRFIRYTDPQDNTRERRINLWTYTPAGSTVPIHYFDTSRHSPVEYDLDMVFGPDAVHALKQLRAGADITTATIADVRFVEDKKFQILHAGIDDLWGGFGTQTVAGTNLNQMLLAPEGPFIGESADTLGNFMVSTLEDKTQ